MVTPTQLEAHKIVETVAVLNNRISERFPDSGLGRTCSKLLNISRQAGARAERLSRPNIWLRFGIAALIISFVIGAIAGISNLSFQYQGMNFVEFIQFIEAGINDIVLISAGLFFLITIESRLRRHQILKALHEIRSIAHIVDMHQLTKDPAYIISKRAKRTKSSPQRTMTAFELTRYLNYCSEMFSLIGKLGALYVQNVDDGVALASVNEIEGLTTGLSRKVWQKIMILQNLARKG